MLQGATMRLSRLGIEWEVRRAIDQAAGSTACQSASQESAVGMLLRQEVSIDVFGLQHAAVLRLRQRVVCPKPETFCD